MPNLPPQHKEFLGLLIKIVSALESRRPYALGHSQRVGNLAKAMAENLGLSGEEADQLYLAGLLHDIGYLVMPDEILHSSEPLTSQQREVVDSQLQVGLQILGSLSLLNEVRKIIRYHNNRFDGLGAPKEPAGHNLPLGSRILHAAHVFEALSSDRPHRKKMSYKGALLEMRHNQGRFDPVVLEALTQVLEVDVTDDSPDQVDLDEFTHWLDKIFKNAVAGRFAVPTVPCAMAVIRKLMRHDGSSLRQMSGIIELEPALALNIISTANSSLFYGMPPVHTVSDALVRIGLNEARNLMVTYVYRTLFRTDQLGLHQTLQTWWEHSLLKASACKSLAGHLGMKNQNYAYLAGLLSDVGMPALLQIFIHQGQDRPLSDWQMEILFSRIESWHHQMGAELLKNAHLPLSLIEAVRQKGHGVFLKRNREALLLALSDEVLKHVLCETGQPDSSLQDLIAEHGLEMKHQDISQAFTATLRRYQALQGLLAATDAESIDRRTLLFDLKASHS